MTPRSIRRAAERRAQKLARKQAQTEPRPSGSAVSEARLAANQANAQLSTGPRTEEGKARSSVNAVKTALTGRTILLPSDDAAAYQHHVEQYVKAFNPVTERESALVQSIADTDWRLQRIPTLEMAIYARGRTEQTNPDAKSGFTDLDTFLKYEKQLRNLQLQEARLRRHREKDLAELRVTQQARFAQEQENLKLAAMLYTAAQHDGKSWYPEDDGFDFSLNDVKDYLKGARAAQLYRESMKQAKAAA
ncbi:MAG TPA: hypothetical protein VHZ55_07550 [Bryobacteraceae bacterium]|jgi:hypothetical protein|nr:hypothetical protein [Bryobacteraceae bacterium]